MAALIGDFGGSDHSPFQSWASVSSISCQSHRQQLPSHHQVRVTQLPQRLPSQHRRDSPLQRHMQMLVQSSPKSIVMESAYSHSPPCSAGRFLGRQARFAVTPSQTDIVGSDTFRIPTPPKVLSPNQSRIDSIRCCSLNGDGDMAPINSSTAQSASLLDSTSIVETEAPASSAAHQQLTVAIPSPTSDVYDHLAPAGFSLGGCITPLRPISLERAPKTILIRDLNHIQTLTQLDSSTGNGPGILNEPALQDLKFEISSMPISDIIEMVAALLAKITTTNDHQHDALNRNACQQRQAEAHNDGSDVHASPFSASVLAFHGKNVPAITILSYLSRIHKYCPTTYEVFLSLLVYFDRMIQRVNDLVVKQQEEHTRQRQGQHVHGTPADPQRQRSRDVSTQAADEGDVTMKYEGYDNSSREDETDEGLGDSDDEEDHAEHAATAIRDANRSPASNSVPLSATYFVVDSFNIHRLIIAGVTCASKFFSDVFYTNSRYAKVGGLPLAELNHLELQFLILNDFRLAIPIEDLEAYATMLVEFYAREVVGQRHRPSNN